MIAKTKIHRAWIVAIGTSIVLFYGMGMTINMLAVLAAAVSKELALSQTQLSSVLSVETATAIVSTIAAVAILKKFSSKKVIAVCAVLAVLGYVVLGLAKSMAFCCVGTFLIGWALGMGFTVPASLIINNWFVEKKGLALSVMAVSTGLANFFASPIMNRIIENRGVQTAAFTHAAVIAFFAIVAQFLLVDRPSDVGMVPYGADESYTPPAHGENVKLFDLGDALKRPAFWVIAFAVFAASGATSAFNQLLPTFLRTEGYTPEYAARIYSFLGLMLIASKLVYGRVVDNVGRNNANRYLYFFLVVSMAFTVTIPLGTLWAPYAAVALAGFANPINTMVIPIFAGDFFEGPHYQQIFTVLNLFMLLGVTAMIFFAGIVADATSNYSYAYVCMGVLNAIAFVLLQRAYKQRGKG